MGDKIFNFFETWFLCAILIFVGLAIGGISSINLKNIIIGGGISAIVSLFAVFID